MCQDSMFAKRIPQSYKAPVGQNEFVNTVKLEMETSKQQQKHGKHQKWILKLFKRPLK